MKLYMSLILLIYSSISSGEVDIPKKIFLELSKNVYTKAFCSKKEGIGITCYDVSIERCIETSKVMEKNCLKKLAPDIPDYIKSKEEAMTIGVEIGKCAGKSYNKMFNERLNSSPKCLKTLGVLINEST